MHTEHMNTRSGHNVKFPYVERGGTQHDWLRYYSHTLSSNSTHSRIPSLQRMNVLYRRGWVWGSHGNVNKDCCGAETSPMTSKIWCCWNDVIKCSTSDTDPMYLIRINLLKPTGHVMHQQFNIQQLYVLPTLYLCVLYLYENKQRLVPLTA